MNQEALITILSETDFLYDMPYEDLHRLATISHSFDYHAGDVIFRAGGPASRAYIVVAGTVSLEMCAAGKGCRDVLTVGPGELLAWSAILEQPRLTATARAVTPARLVQIDSSQLADICDEHPAFGYQIMRRTARALAQRLTATRMQLLAIYEQGDPAEASPRRYERGNS
jgi:CRP-like cAMP-binding protein